MKKLVFLAIVAATLGLTIAPTPALADSVDFGFTGGTLTSGGTALSGSSTLTVVQVLPGGSGFASLNLGTVTFTTGTLATGSLAAGGTFNSGGTLTVTANGTWGGLSNGAVIYSGSFSGTTNWSVAGTSYVLSGPLSGALSSALAALLFPGCTGCNGTGAGALTTLTVTGSVPFSSPAGISSGDINAAVPEPGTLALFGSGLLGIAGAIRRKLTS